MEILRSPEFVNAHRKKPTDFTRERKLTFEVIVAFLLQLVGGTSLQPALDLFFQTLDPDGKLVRFVTKSAFCQARQKLNPSALAALVALWVRDLHERITFPRWCGLRVVAVDGTCLRLAPWQENVESFGKGPSGKGSVVMARVLALFAVASRQILHVQIGKYEDGERNLLHRALGLLTADDLLVMDRGFPAVWVYCMLIAHGVHFCARTDGLGWSLVKNFLRSGLPDDVVEYTPNASVQRQLVQMGLPTPATIRLRFVRVVLPTGKIEVLVSSMVDRTAFPVNEFAGLYRSRWNIEEAFKVLKHRLHLEGFSGELPQSVEQEIHAKVLMANIACALCYEAWTQLPEPQQELNRVNCATAVTHLRHIIISFLKKSENALLDAIDQLVHVLTKDLVRHRPDRHFPRRHTIGGAQRPRKTYR